MKKQKICIIGGSLTGLATAISLSKLDCKVDIIAKNINQSLKSNRTVAISENNFKFLNRLNISKSLKQEVWICSKMKLYTEMKNKKFSEIFHLNKENENENVFYMFRNSKLIKLMLNKIKKIKSINLKENKKVSEIYNSRLMQKVKFDNSSSKYNLVIICTGYNSNLVKDIFRHKMIQNSYGESAVSVILKHQSIKNNIARQIFLSNSIFALLPISNNKTSIVWSVKDNIINNNSFYRKKIKLYAANFLKKIKFDSDIESKKLNLLIRKNYYLDRILLFGDALHIVHPFIGQSFNMTLRDLKVLEKILLEKINLGLDIGSSDILEEFSNKIKPINFSFSLGSDILKNMLKFKKARDDVFKILNKSNVAKDIFYDVANKGFRF